MRNIIFLFLSVTSLHGATTLLRIESSITFLNGNPNPLALNIPVTVELIYDDQQAEDYEPPASSPSLDADNLASSRYSITNGVATVTIGSYVWSSTSYQITIRNDVPFLTKQDSIYITFLTSPPAAFASLGFNETSNIFNYFIQDYSIDGIEPMNLLTSSSLPSAGTIIDVNAIDSTEGQIYGVATPIKWTAFMSVTNKITVSSIPEPQSSIFIMLSALILAHRKRGIII